MEVGGGQNEYALMGFFGRLNYDYKGKYLVEVSGRYDGTSRFKRGHRWGFFPSFSLVELASEPSDDSLRRLQTARVAGRALRIAPDRGPGGRDSRPRPARGGQFPPRGGHGRQGQGRGGFRRD